jgi:hypothetical protein
MGLHGAYSTTPSGITAQSRNPALFPMLTLQITSRYSKASRRLAWSQSSANRSPVSNAFLSDESDMSLAFVSVGSDLRQIALDALSL